MKNWKEEVARRLPKGVKISKPKRRKEIRPGRIRLQRVCKQWRDKVAISLQRHDIKYFQDSYHNQFRLLNWKAWTLKYAVSLDWVTDHILQIYGKARRGPSNSLGISIAAVTGEKAEGWIKEHVDREFPGGENLSIRRATLRARMIGLPIRIKTKQDVGLDEYLADYRKQTAELRNRSLTESKKYTRAWRGNPWL